MMGNPIIQSPNIDRLGREGVTFQNNFCATAICMSSRASIFTGLHTKCHGINSFEAPLKQSDFERSYPELLHAAGYRTGFIGKYGVGSEPPADRYDYWKGFPGQGFYFEKGAAKPVHLTNLMGDQAVEFLEGCQPGKPFCLSVSFKAPHAQDGDPRQFLYDPALEEFYKDATIPKPRTTSAAHFDTLPEFIRTSEGHLRWAKRFDTEEKYQRMVKAYYRLITGVDTVVGRVRETLARRGFADNTVIIFTSDNGMFLAEHGMADKWLMYEESIRTPLVIFDPRLLAKQRGARRKQMALNIDIAPTILDFAQLPVPKGVQGKSLRPLLATDPEKWRKEWFYSHYFQGEGKYKIPPSEGIRTERWKYIRYLESTPLREELYDIVRDPLEEHNLADLAEHAGRLDELRKRWRVWSEKINRWDRNVDWSDPA